MQNPSQQQSLSAKALNAMTTKEAALALAQSSSPYRILPVCPPDHHSVSVHHTAACTNPGKGPLITHWPSRATKDITTIEGWFREWPKSNVGIVTGTESGIIAVDCDGEYGQRRILEILRGPVPPTQQFTTPGGGMRYLFRAPNDGLPLRSFTERDPEGPHSEISLLVDGQMSVIPPSSHANGGNYAWIDGCGPGDIPLADAPQALLELVQRKPVVAPSDDVCTTHSGGAFTAAAQLTDLGEPALQRVASRCQRVHELTEEQTQAGCDEPTWHRVVAMLVRGGQPAAALAFSRLSTKHDDHSEQRIAQLSTDGALAGPTRCTTFGCDRAQVGRCFAGRVHDRDGEVTNSPAAFIANVVMTEDSEPGDPADSAPEIGAPDGAELLDSAYEISNASLCRREFTPKGKSKTVQLANFFARITKDVLRDDGSERQRLYEIQGAMLSTGRRLEPILVPAEDFEGMKWLSKWGAEPTLQPGTAVREAVRHAIQTTAHAASRVNSFAHTGWAKIGGQWAYLHSEGAIGASNVRVELDPRLGDYALPGPPDPGTANEAMRASLRLMDIASHRVTHALWALTFLSPLCEALRGASLEPKFLLWLQGYTGTRKTTLAKLFLCHFGNLLEHPPSSFKDTANAIEKRTFLTKDSLILIDDYHPTASPSEAKALQQRAQQILRSYGDRIGRGRMKQDTSLREDYPPRGMAVVTAEDTITGGSSTARLFPVELKAEDVNLARLTEAQRQSDKLAQAMAGYVAWVGTQMPGDLGARLASSFRDRRNEAARLQVHGRLHEAAAWLYMGLETGLRYALEVGAVTQEFAERVLTEAWTAFLGTAKEQGTQVDEERPAELFMNTLRELLANGTLWTFHLDLFGDADDRAPGTKIGWQDYDYYYLLPTVTFTEVTRYLADQGRVFPLSERGLWKQLADEGMIVTAVELEGGKKRTRRTHQKYIGNDRSRKLWMPVNLLEREELPERESGPSRRVTPTPIDEMFT